MFICIHLTTCYFASGALIRRAATNCMPSRLQFN